MTLSPLFSDSGASLGQNTACSIRFMCSRSLTRYGMSKMPNRSTSELITVDGSTMSSVPSLTFCSISLSPPSWLDP